jgi:hypothetical protein
MVHARRGRRVKSGAARASLPNVVGTIRSPELCVHRGRLSSQAAQGRPSASDSLASAGRADRERPPVTTFVEIEHQPGQWVRARVDKQGRYQGVWKVSVYYYLDGGLQFLRVLPADRCRSTASDQPECR